LLGSSSKHYLTYIKITLGVNSREARLAMQQAENDSTKILESATFFKKQTKNIFN